MDKQQIHLSGKLVEQLLGCFQARNTGRLVIDGELVEILPKHRQRSKLGPTVLVIQVLSIFFFPSLSIATQVGDSGTTLISQSTMQKDRRIALVIGNEAYAKGDKLKNPINDAKAITQELTSLGFEVRLKTNLNQLQMQEEIRQFNQKLHSGVVGLFYFAGHGVRLDGENYLIPIGSKTEYKSDIRNEGVQLGNVLEAMDKANNSINIVMIDACRQPFSGSGNSRVVGERGLLSVQARGTLISFATAPGQGANDGDGTDHSPYTRAVLEFIQQPVPIETMFKRVRKRVVEDTHNDQVPWDHSSLIGEFSFNLGNIIPTPLPSRPQSPLPPFSSSPPVNPSVPPLGSDAASGSSSKIAAARSFEYGKKRYAMIEDSVEKRRIHYQEAILAYSEAIKFQPDEAEYYYHRGEAYYALDDINSAYSDYGKAVQLKPDFAEALKRRSTISIGRGNDQDALLDLNKLIEIIPNIDYYYNRALLRKKLKDLNGAIADYSQMIALAPSSSRLYIRRGDEYRGMGNLRNAISDYSEAIKIEESNSSSQRRHFIYEARGRAYFDLGDLNSAILDYSKAIEIGPEPNPVYYYNRGLAYEILGGNRKNAIADFKQSAKLYQKLDSPDSKEMLGYIRQHLRSYFIFSLPS
jgi:tetratricopeptide (TPR) repeat protein